MLTSFLQVRKKTLLFAKDQDPNMPVGRVIDFVIRPQDGAFEALWVQTMMGLRLLDRRDVVRWTSRGIIIETEDDCVQPEDLPRLKKVLNSEVRILQAPVWNKKAKIGVVEDFIFDTLSPYLLKLVVGSRVLFWRRERLIPRAQISRITHEGIFVKENVLKNEQNTSLPESVSAEIGD